MITKSGYGLLAEAAAAGLPVLYRPRPDWPETPWLERWIGEVGIGRPLPEDPQALARTIHTIAASPRPRPVPPSGVEEAVAILERYL